MKKAIVTGISGQDGAYLAELLLSNNYKVFGIVRTNSTNFSNLEYLKINDDIEFINCDLLNISSVEKLITTINLDEIYNLAAQSHVKVSFELPEYTAETGKILIEVDPNYYRPAEVETLLGDPSKAKNQLGWNPTRTSFEDLVKIMVQHDLDYVKRN